MFELFEEGGIRFRQGQLAVVPVLIRGASPVVLVLRSIQPRPVHSRPHLNDEIRRASLFAFGFRRDSIAELDISDGMNPHFVLSPAAAFCHIFYIFLELLNIGYGKFVFDRPDNPLASFSSY